MNGSTEEYYKAFGKRLSDRMAERHVTQAQLSSELKIPKGTVSNWMNGKRLPRAGAMDTLCHYLQCTRADLLDEPQEPVIDTPQPVQEPATGAVDPDTARLFAALDAAGYGHLRALLAVAKDADKTDIDFVTETLRNINARKGK